MINISIPDFAIIRFALGEVVIKMKDEMKDYKPPYTKDQEHALRILAHTEDLIKRLDAEKQIQGT